MLMPVFSVSVIGLVGASVTLLLRRRRAGPAVVRGLLGAWAGFLVGGALGGVIDVVAGSGVYIAYIGHLGALLGTIWLLRSRSPFSTAATP